ncbi:MAG TPA: hypothetical protein VGC09_00480 [Rhodopila sp.]
MPLDIVTLNVAVLGAPVPSTLQQTAILVTEGATNLAVGAMALLTQANDLTPILSGQVAITGLAWASGAVTVTQASGPVPTVGERVTISGALPVAYNGAVTVVSVTGETWTYALAANPGAETAFGHWQRGNVPELQAMVDEWFAQGGNASVYVFEAGAGTTATTVAELGTYLQENPNTLYSATVPRGWPNEPTFPALVSQYESDTALFYFYITATQANYTNFTAQMKSARVFIEAPDTPVTEFGAAALMYREISQVPSAVNRRMPAANAFLFDVTPYPKAGNIPLLTTLLAAKVNIATTADEGGLSNVILKDGTGMDGTGFNFWFAVDWMQIQSKRNLAARVIQGANDPTNPLTFDQTGINDLVANEQQTINSAVTFGLIRPGATVTATTYADYIQQSPDEAGEGIYNGLAVTFTPMGYFTAITLNLTAIQIPTS